MDRQEQRIKGVTAGSEIPVYRMYVGTGANQTRLKDVRKTLLKFKSYQPTHHKNKLMAAIHPRTRSCSPRPSSRCSTSVCALCS